MLDHAPVPVRGNAGVAAKQPRRPINAAVDCCGAMAEFAVVSILKGVMPP
jgi:hypothetical protein